MKQKPATDIYQTISQQLIQSAPWLAGAGLALGHIAMTSSCTLPQQGRCSTCGSCVIALGALVSWAVIKNKKDDDLYYKK